MKQKKQKEKVIYFAEFLISLEGSFLTLLLQSAKMCLKQTFFPDNELYDYCLKIEFYGG